MDITKRFNPAVKVICNVQDAIDILDEMIWDADIKIVRTELTAARVHLIHMMREIMDED